MADGTVRTVGIGASAGGLEALKEFFAATPPDSGLAFVVVQHLDPARESYTAQLLARQTPMPVAQAENGTAVRANSVYTIPPGKFISIDGGRLRLSEPIKRDGLRLPIDFFFRALAQDQGDSAIAVVLSGGGSDGALGTREVHGVGGIVLVQEPRTARFDMMPRSALASGRVDAVLPPGKLPQAILAYAQMDGEIAQRVEEDGNHDLQPILEIVEKQIAVSGFRKEAVWRCVRRRMGLLGIAELADYARLVRDVPDETARLAKDLLAGVTSFFRDPAAFEELRAEVIAPLMQAKTDFAPLRAWAVGCSTGEEIYSMAILLREEMARAEKNFPLRLFASDIDPDGLKCAREGIYPESIAADVSEERLARFFIKRGDGRYAINSEIRECVTFAAHDFLADPPFGRMDLISCRNLLVDLEPEVQEKLFDLFVFALNPGGHLFLGKSESIESNPNFESVSLESNIYVRNGTGAHGVGSPARGARVPWLHSKSVAQPVFKLSELNSDVLARHFNATVVLIDEHGTSLHFYGRTGKYLQLPAGDVTLNLYEMIEFRHASKLRTAVQQAYRDHDSVTLEGLEFNSNGTAVTADVTVSCCVEPQAGKRLAAVIFQERPERSAADLQRPPAVPDIEGAVYVAQLESETKNLRGELQRACEDFQGSRQDLMASNEEMTAVNEELQSTNEEMEASKEELQSVNEELTTVNQELNVKVGELSQTNDDIANFLNSSQVGTIFLDRDYRIRRFTTAATRLLNLLPVDVGRPVADISSRLINVDLPAIAESVLQNLDAVETEVRSQDGSWYLMRCLPYRTLDDKIAGVVFTFTDVTRLRDAQDYAENIVATMDESLIVLTAELEVVSANPAFYRTFQTSAEKTVGRRIYELGNNQWNIQSLRGALESVLRADARLENYEVEHEFPAIGKKVMSVNARQIRWRTEESGPQLLLLVINDVTDRRRAEVELKQFNRALETRVQERTEELRHVNADLLQDIEKRKTLEQQLLQAQKLEAMGTLAGGIAHDFNNILNIIQNYSDLLREFGAKYEEIAEPSITISDTVKRAAAVVQQLLTLARKTELRFEAVDLSAVLQSLAKLLGETFPKVIAVSLDTDPRLPRIRGDANQIMQVLLNLCINARDAMPSGGRLDLRSAAVGRNSVPSEFEALAPLYAVCEVSDSGTGMDQEVMRRIFEPFFTTKETSQGTGLGLAVAYAIVKNHDGFIQVESESRVGTRFRVYLPALADADQ